MANNEEKNISKETTKPEYKSAANVEQTEVFEKFMKIFLERNANAEGPFDTKNLDKLSNDINVRLTRDRKAAASLFPNVRTFCCP